MSLFKKKEAKKELPSLPQLPEMPRFPELPKESSMPLLPPFPFTFQNSKLEEIRVPPQKPMTMEMHELPTFRETPEMPKFQMPEIPESRPREPIFVKIDKYREAIMHLEMIKRKLHETSNLLEKIKDTRAKENEELNIWMNEINAIKEKISIIDKKLFSI